MGGGDHRAGQASGRGSPWGTAHRTEPAAHAVHDDRVGVGLPPAVVHLISWGPTSERPVGMAARSPRACQVHPGPWLKMCTAPATTIVQS